MLRADQDCGGAPIAQLENHGLVAGLVHRIREVLTSRTYGHGLSYQVLYKLESILYNSLHGEMGREQSAASIDKE